MPRLSPEDFFLAYFRNRCADLAIPVSGNVGLNADWCVTSYCLTDCEPNMTDGAFYLVDGEDGTWSIVRRYHDPELVQAGDVEPNPHDETSFEGASDGPHFEVIAETIYLGSEHVTAMDIIREVDKLIRLAGAAGIQTYRQFEWEVLVQRTRTESARITLHANSWSDLEGLAHCVSPDWVPEIGHDVIEVIEAHRKES